MSRRFAQFALLSTLALAAASCDDSQNITADNPELGENIIEVLINEVSKGTIDAYGLEAEAYKDVKIEGTDAKVVPISTLIQKVLKVDDKELDGFLAKHKCNYESRDDGFRPSDKGDRCAPVSCTNSNLSYLDVNTGKLVYDEKFPVNPLPGCYRVKNLGKVLMTEVNADAQLFALYIDGTKMGEIDLNTMSDKIQTVNGKKLVKLEDVFKRLQPNKKADGFMCDLADKDGKKLSADEKCPARACKDTLGGMIEVKSLNISDDAGAKVAACYEMTGAAALHMFTPETDKPLNIVVMLDDKEIGSIDAKSMTDKIKEKDGIKYVLASDIIEALMPGKKLDDYLCNYLGYDEEKGVYDPTSKGMCAEKRSCSYAATAEINLTTAKMSMTDKDAQNCHNVGGLTTIKLYTNGASKPEPVPYKVSIAVDGKDPIEVDAAALTDKINNSNGQKTIKLSDVLAAGIKDFAPDKYTCDYAAADGFKASKKSDCQPVRDCTYAEKMELSLDEKKTINSEGIGCFGVKDFKTIIVTTK